LPFDDDSFDAVIAFDLIEHLTQQDGLRLIAEAERVARRTFCSCDSRRSNRRLPRRPVIVFQVRVSYAGVTRARRQLVKIAFYAGAAR
jgi:ubiquinone/menaquinone biosynthesis C-methylase UbiE